MVSEIFLFTFGALGLGIFATFIIQIWYSAESVFHLKWLHYHSKEISDIVQQVTAEPKEERIVEHIPQIQVQKVAYAVDNLSYLEPTEVELKSLRDEIIY